MKLFLLKKSHFIAFSIPFLLILGVIVISKSTFYVQNPYQLSMAMTLDLVLVIPFLYYLLIRKTNISNSSVSILITLGIVLAGYIVPAKNQWVLTQLKFFVLPLLELVLIVFVVKKVKRVRRLYQHQSISLDFYDALQNVSQEIFPKKIALIIASEIGMLYYSLLYFKRKQLANNEFTYHKNGISTSMLIGFIMMILFETVGVHFFIHRYSVFWAWVVSVLSVYTALQLVALLRSFAQRPSKILLKEEILVLRYGYFSETKIPLQEIVAVTFYQKDISESTTVQSLSFFGKIGDYNLKIDVQNEQVIRSIYGITKKYNSLAFFVDDKQRFKEMLTTALANQK